MPLTKQNISIAFSQGIDTKTDPRQVVPGKLEVLQNSRFTEGMSLKKRNGYTELFDLSSGVGRSAAAFEDQLLAFDDNSLYSYVPEEAATINTGYCQPVDVKTKLIISPATPPNSAGYTTSAVHSSGYIIYCYTTGTSSTSTGAYTVFSQTTGRAVLSGSAGGGSAPVDHIRCFALGNYLVILTASGSTLRYTAISTLTFAVTTATLGSTQAAHNSYVQGVLISGTLYIAWNSASAGNDRLAVTSLSATLVQGSTSTLAVTGNVIKEIALWNDSSSPSNLWIAYHGTTNLYYRILKSSDLSVVLAETNFNSGTVVKLIGMITPTAGISVVLLETETALSGSGALSNRLILNVLNSDGTFMTGNLSVNSLSLTSLPFNLHSDTSYMYFFATYGSAIGANLEPTYFLMKMPISGIAFSAGDAAPLIYPTIIAKISALNAQPYNSIANYGSSYISADTFQVSVSGSQAFFSFLKASQVSTVSGTLLSTYGVSSGFIDATNNDAYQFDEAGKNLNITGGLLTAYDGYLATEQNFNIFPENLFATFATTGGSIAKAVYQYIAIYQWSDAKGNIHRSAPSVAYSLDASGSSTDTNTITVRVPSYSITQKIASSTNNVSGVLIVIYRNTPTGPSGNPTDIFYKIGTITNSTTSNSQTLADTSADASIIGNEILYTTGGVLENSGGPPSSGITVFKNRLFVIDAEDRNLLWYSKQILENTPVEMSESLTFFVDPRFGEITSIAVMDDKLIVFKENAMFYITGNGPDSTGANNDFTDAVYVSSNAGCVDPRSVVTTQDGLMFKSNKGIWLLDRGLGLSYIGAPMESFNSSHVTGAELIPDSTQVEFTLDDGTSLLMYDYFYKQWSVYTNHAAVSATVYQDLLTYITSDGSALQETEGLYSDDGTAILQSLTTSWLSFAGLQGFQRVYRLYLLTQYISPHGISVGIAYDYDDTVVQTVTLDATTLAAELGNDVGQWRINIDRQKCQSIRLTISETIDAANPTPGAGLILEAIGLLVGSSLSYPKLPAIQSGTS